MRVAMSSVRNNALHVIGGFIVKVRLANTVSIPKHWLKAHTSTHQIMHSREILSKATKLGKAFSIALDTGFTK